LLAASLIFRWHIIKRADQQHDKIVAQIYLKDWNMKNEILRKAQLYEQHTINMQHRSNNDCKSNKNKDISSVDSKDNIQLMTPTPTALNHEEDESAASALLKPMMPHCNRSGVHVHHISSSKGTSFCDILIPNPSADPSVTTFKLKSKHKRNKKNLKLRKYKEFFNTHNDLNDNAGSAGGKLQSMIAIDKL